MSQNGQNINPSDVKSESDRLCQELEATMASNFNQRNALASASKVSQAHFNNYIGNNIPREETKSQTSHHHHQHHLSQSNQHLPNNQHQNYNHNPQKNPLTTATKVTHYHSLSQQQQHSQANQTIHDSDNMLLHHQSSTNSNQRNGLTNMTRSTTNPQLYQYPAFQHLSSPSSSKTTHLEGRNNIRPIPSNTSTNTTTSFHHRNPSSVSTTMGYSQTSSSTSIARDDYRSAHNPNHDQRDRETNEVVTMIKEEEELDHGLDAFKDSELDTLGSFERNLPVELSFLIRQQAYCMARMNYLDRQIRELKEAKQIAPQASTTTTTSSSSSNPMTQIHTNRHMPTTNSTNNAVMHTKNGNFIPSDDSGGEYSRATISDDDELSSLLDQIAKSVRPERNVNPNVRNIVSSSNQPRANYSVINQQPQQYAIINSNQLHHQAVPVFVMSSPIAVAHPSRISSNVLPGVHFQPEPRYNQYYEDFYVQNNSSSSTLQRHNGIRSQQFDGSMSAIEQLVSQKEKRQITSQLKSADNWYKMRSSGNLNNNFTNPAKSNGPNNVGGGVGHGDERNLPASASSATIATENSTSVIEENRSR